jgi:hypothetical protein
MMNVVIFIGAIVTSIFFYRLRCRRPFRYGLAELLVGVAVIYFTLWPVETNYLLLVQGEPGLGETFLVKSVGVLAGIYVLVRGLDNMSRALPSSWEPWWKRLFHVSR